MSEELKLAQEYYVNGDYDKAIELYKPLSQKNSNIPIIHNNYLDAMLKLQQYDEAKRYVSKLQKQYKGNLQYKIDDGIIEQVRGNTSDADKIFKSVVKDINRYPAYASKTAQYFLNKDLSEYALETYLLAREKTGQQALYVLEIANTYRLLGNKDMMVREYLRYIDFNPRNINYVKNILQSLLTDQEDLETFELALFDRIQENPDGTINNELLIWVKLQQNDFYGALLQAKALDKKRMVPGEKTMEIGDIALKNSDYETAIAAYNHIAKNYPKGYQYERARRQLIKAQEYQTKNTYPVDKQQILDLIEEYQDLINEIGLNRTTLEALRSKALLHANYLNEYSLAQEYLDQVIFNPSSGQPLIARAKIDKGDIHLLTNEPWESTLLYSQVEKENKETPIGYEAKLRNAKLNFYTGDFQLALAHLNILKDATTREIANDALDLSLLIQNNSVLDTSEQALKDFAAIQLKIFKNDIDTSLILLEEMLRKYSSHSLRDEILYTRADLNIKTGNYEESVKDLEELLSSPVDIISDDAAFLLAETYHLKLNNREKAMELYSDFLKRYPGSVYSAEARKRFRKLRGDNL